MCICCDFYFKKNILKMMMIFLLLLLLLLHGAAADAIPERTEYAIQFKDVSEDPQKFADARHLRYMGPILQLPGYHRFANAPAPLGASSDSGTPLGVPNDSGAHSTSRDSGAGASHFWVEDPDQKVQWMERQIARQQHTRYAAPSDPLYNSQWHLSMAKVKEAWDGESTGKGVRIAIVDDGVQHAHPDLLRNYNPSLSHDYNEGDADPNPGPGNYHGTSCAGVALAQANNTHCGSGAAPDATLAGIRLIAAPTTDVDEALALSHRSDVMDIYSSSWGPVDDGATLAGPGRVTNEAFAMNVARGRGGKGSIYVWASGNGRHVGDSCAYDGYASSPYTIAVGALDHSEKQAYYSEGCAALMCVAPSSGRDAQHGITTTDVNIPGQGYSPGQECTSKFGGTSSAAPLVAGIIALALQANPSLTWRDVQILLAKTSSPVDPSGINNDWSINERGFRHSERYGFGKIDARAMVTQAKTWSNVPIQRGFSSGYVRVALGIAGDGTPLRLVHTFSGSRIVFVEHVLLRVNIRHARRGQLRVRLKSPENVVSTLASVHPDAAPDYRGWLFTSVRHFGEASADGDWQIAVEDLINDQYSNGLLEGFELAIFGH